MEIVARQRDEDRGNHRELETDRIFLQPFEPPKSAHEPVAPDEDEKARRQHPREKIVLDAGALEKEGRKKRQVIGDRNEISGRERDMGEMFARRRERRCPALSVHRLEQRLAVKNIEADRATDGIGIDDEPRHAEQRIIADDTGNERHRDEKARADDRGERRHRRPPCGAFENAARKESGERGADDQHQRQIEQDGQTLSASAASNRETASTLRKPPGKVSLSRQATEGRVPRYRARPR